ncbi:hypothetical protein SAMN05192529_11942 [Arachidicoccus rhizosphaerae]|uniref:Uncharacterized protein n=1 Tax=Arachidicoccus rhizosphaerae TaxID=551991 RepID=A0A1H4B9Z2_9BACT|nr:hypothetical protein [Arachidicoccus rhizosphaerae]SEA44916.1 hypothetical protein SAMN05192529_11942 [Arachidicoccus rhizosphaerae]
MYVTVQFIILEILLGLIFLVILYFMLRELLKKIIRRELKDLKEPLQVLANYLVQQSQEPEGPDDPDGNEGAGQPGGGPLPASSPEKIPEVPVDIADEFNQLKNTNRISAYNIRVQKIWDLFKQRKITLKQYREELIRLKKEFGIPTGLEDAPKDDQLLKQGNPGKGAKLKPLTPTPSAAPKEKVKKIDTEPEQGDKKDPEVEKGAAKKSSPGTDMHIKPLN